MAEQRTPAANDSGHPLETLFAPRSIAVVGATEKSPWTGFIAKNFRDFAYPGRVFAINRGGTDVLGMKGFASCGDVGEPVDVAFITVPQAAVLDALADAAAAGVRNAVILTAGYGEAGAEGVALQEQLLARTSEWGMNIWGPNSLGFNNVSARTPISSIPALLPILAPRIAIVSQSGATASELNEFAHSQNIGTSFVAATGNEAQLTLADIVDYLVDHDETRAIAIFAESIRDPARFEQAATRARARRKPIVILKIGRSDLATEVAKAHTGSLAGNDKVFDAVCERLGIIRVFSTEDLIVTAGLLAATGPLPAQGLEFISISGGACTLVADGAEAAGIMVPPHPPETAAALAAAMPGFGSTLNPLDVTGAVVRDTGLLERVIPIAAASPDVGLVAINISVPVAEGQAVLPSALSAIGRAVKAIDKPAIMVLTTARSLTDMTRQAMEDHGLPHILCGIDAMLRAAGKAAWWSGQLSQSPPPFLFGQAPPSGTARPALDTERAVLDYLASRSIPVIPARVATSRAEAEAAGIEGPLVLKILSPDIAHKTEVGGVRLHVAPDAAGEAFDEICAAVAAARPDARIEGVILSPMRSGGVELLVGITRDPIWGLTITVGFGGILVELVADVAIAPLPVSPGQVRDMLGRLRGVRLLQGFRNIPPADLDRLAAVIARIGDEAIQLGPDLESLEINPILVRGADIEALDGLVHWKV
ncbi:acetate--CoA ligase family protein [Sphingobium estronivorans]|uniref:acetate--CoA ligase family protein n=1 Tax=Sphingobium estronivorans TaxID=1577690 RepID=UPI0013C2C410|nr:acetate--CoA ligase family protein [Sphingobium estronivorans]